MHHDEPLKVLIRPETISVGRFHALLSEHNPEDVTLEALKSPEKRGTDPAVLIAIVGTVGSTLGTLITALFSLLAAARANKVVIEVGDNSRIEIPAGTSQEELNRILQAASKIKPKSIRLTK